MRKMLCIAALLLLPMAGCRKVSTTTPAAPALVGSCNPADSSMYQTLIFAQGSLLNLKATLADPGTAPQTVTALKPYVSQAVAAYNLAKVAWQTYHGACMANPKLSPATAQTAVNNLSTAINAVPKVN